MPTLKDGQLSGILLSGEIGTCVGIASFSNNDTSDAVENAARLITSLRDNHDDILAAHAKNFIESVFNMSENFQSSRLLS